MKKKILNTLCLGLVGVTTVAFAASCGKTEDDGTATYTYRSTYSGSFSKGGWDPLTWQLSLDDIPLTYTTCGLYAFNYNEDKTTYKVDTELASAAPVDVSTDNGYEESGYVYKVTLRDDAYFDNGVQITAQTFVDSYKLLIDAAYSNYRATTYESDGVVIKNSALYHYKGQTKLTSLSDVMSFDSVTSETIDNDSNVEKKYYTAVSNLGVKKDQIKTDFPRYTDSDFITNDTYICVGTTYADAKKNLEDLWVHYEVVDTAAEADSYFDSYTFLNYTYPEHDDAWFDENVGIKATGTYELTFTLATPIDEFNFEYNLSSTWLVEPEAYKKCTTTASDGTKTSTYNKTAETSVSYGPYKMSTYTTTEFTLEKNDSWYGYKDSKYDGQYQTTNIKYSKVEESSTQLMGFKNGDYDDVSLSSDTISQYSNSERLYVTPETYLMSYFMNSNKEYLEALDKAGTTKNAVIFAYDDFRAGLSYSVNRDDAALAAPGSKAAATVLNSLYMADAQNGVAYRDTTSGKSVYKSVYGGDDVSASYSTAKAVECFNKAYDAAVKAGDWKEGTKELVINMELTNTTGSEYTQCVANVEKYLEAGLKESKFGEVNVTINAKGTAGSRYSNLLAGKIVMAFCAWGGNAFDPYGFFQVYFTDDYNYMPGFSPSTEQVTITVAGKAETMTYTNWWKALSTGMYSQSQGFAQLEADDKTSTKDASRVYILSQLESAYLKQYEIIPVYALSEASLVSYKVQYPVSEYVNGVGFGGIQYLTYNYTDSEWEKVKGSINY